MALISLEHVSKIYAKGTRPALDDVTVHIDRGSFVFLVGASGSGKTTLLSLLLHEEEATDGELHVAGNDLRRMSARQVPHYRRSMGFIFQDYKLLNNKTVWQNVAFALEVIGSSRSAVRSLVPKVLETVGLTGKEKNYPHELSGGEAQRVAIARAYVNHPQILLADEPTGNLDPTTSLGIMEVLDAINRTGTTVVMATHNEEIVNSMRKRVIELHNGKVVRDQEHGSYDSALFFPDADVESKAQRILPDGLDAKRSSNQQTVHENEPAIGGTKVIEATAVGESADTAPIGERDADSHPDEGNRGDLPATADTRHSDASTMQAMDAVVHVMQDGEDDDGIARLANSVHSGRTGRYGEAFQSAETTMTWGRGIEVLHEAEQGSKKPAEAYDDGTDEVRHDQADKSVEDSVGGQGKEPEAKPSEGRVIPPPPVPPAPPISTTSIHHDWHHDVANDANGESSDASSDDHTLKDEEARS